MKTNMIFSVNLFRHLEHLENKILNNKILWRPDIVQVEPLVRSAVNGQRAKVRLRIDFLLFRREKAIKEKDLVRLSVIFFLVSNLIGSFRCQRY